MTTQPDTLARLREDAVRLADPAEPNAHIVRLRVARSLPALLDIAEAAQAVDKARDAHVSEAAFILLLDNLAAALDAADSGEAT